MKTCKCGSQRIFIYKNLEVCADCGREKNIKIKKVISNALQGSEKSY